VAGSGEHWCSWHVRDRDKDSCAAYIVEVLSKGSLLAVSRGDEVGERQGGCIST
jgi:hypothetical protein